MLVAACTCSNYLVPLRLSPKLAVSGKERIFSHLQNRFPEDHLSLLTAEDEGTEVCPAVLEYCDLKGLYQSVSRLDQAGV